MLSTVSKINHKSGKFESDREMRRRTTRKSSAAALLVTPTPPPSATAAKSPTLSPAESPAVRFDFDFNGFADIASSLKKKGNKNSGAGASGSKRMQPGFSPPPQRSLKSVNTISDLKELASSNLDSINHQLERSHSEILKEIESSKCRLLKRYKIQTQACQQLMDEAEKEHRKISDRMNEGREAMKAQYAEFIAEAQATASRLCKTTIPELAKKSEKEIASLQSHFGISSTVA